MELLPAFGGGVKKQFLCQIIEVISTTKFYCSKSNNQNKSMGGSKWPELELVFEYSFLLMHFLMFLVLLIPWIQLQMQCSLTSHISIWTTKSKTPWLLRAMLDKSIQNRHWIMRYSSFLFSFYYIGIWKRSSEVTLWFFSLYFFFFSPLLIFFPFFPLFVLYVCAMHKRCLLKSKKNIYHMFLYENNKEKSKWHGFIA